MNSAREGSLGIKPCGGIRHQVSASLQIAHQRGIVRYHTDKGPTFLMLRLLSRQAAQYVIQIDILALCMGMIARPPLLLATHTFHTRRALTSQQMERLWSIPHMECLWAAPESRLLLWTCALHADTQYQRGYITDALPGGGGRVLMVARGSLLSTDLIRSRYSLRRSPCTTLA